MSSWKVRRIYIAGTAQCIVAISFVAFMALFAAYDYSYPTQPNSALGLVYPLNNHGRYVYISGAESTGLVLLAIAFSVGLVVAVIAVPKEGFKLPSVVPGASRLLTYLNWGADVDPVGLTWPMKRFFLFVGLGYIAFIYFVRPLIARFAASHGFVLSMG
jgi:hypothetical protein